MTVQAKKLAKPRLLTRYFLACWLVNLARCMAFLAICVRSAVRVVTCFIMEDEVRRIYSVSRMSMDIANTWESHAPPLPVTSGNRLKT